MWTQVTTGTWTGWETGSGELWELTLTGHVRFSSNLGNLVELKALNGVAFYRKKVKFALTGVIINSEKSSFPQIEHFTLRLTRQAIWVKQERHYISFLPIISQHHNGAESLLVTSTNLKWTETLWACFFSTTSCNIKCYEENSSLEESSRNVCCWCLWWDNDWSEANMIFSLIGVLIHLCWSNIELIVAMSMSDNSSSDATPTTHHRLVRKVSSR